MSIVEIGALAQLVGAIAILLSLVFVVVELRKSFKQNNIANTLQRAIEREKLIYARMDEGLAKLLVKAYRSYNELKDFEKIQFEAYARAHCVKLRDSQQPHLEAREPDSCYASI